MLDCEELLSSSMPPKAMTPEAIQQMVAAMIEGLKDAEGIRGNKEVKREKEKVKIEWGDETDEEVEDGEETTIVAMPQYQNLFLDAFKSISKDNLDGLPTYGGNLNGEELLDWIEALNNHFHYKELAEEKRVNVTKSRMRGSTLVWWNMMQEERIQEGKKKITSWEGMMIRLKA